jgi:hypothetical protein
MKTRTLAGPRPLLVGFAFLLLSSFLSAAYASTPEVADLNGVLSTFQHPYWEHVSVFDPVRNRLLVFDGTSQDSPARIAFALNLSGTPSWSSLTTAGTPPGKSFNEGSAIYDPVRDRIIFYGGQLHNQIWSLTLSGTPTWSQIVPSGTVPTRSRHTAIYDPLRDRMLVFGGYNVDLGNNDLYELTFTGTPTWHQIILPSPPPKRVNHTAIYDPVRDRMIVYGGTSNPTVYADVWALNLSGPLSWTQLSPAGPAPAARNNHSAIYDPAGDRMVVFGGNPQSQTMPALASDVWALSLGSPAWTQISPSGTAPAARQGHTGTYDSVAGRMIVVGGGTGFSLAEGFEVGAVQLSLGGSPAWSELGPVTYFPKARRSHSAVWDPAGGRMIVFGGKWAANFASNPPPYAFGNDAWQLSLGSSPTWSLLVPVGTPPSARAEHSAIWDRLRNRMILFGGESSTGYLNDVWELSVSGTPTWTQLTPIGTPPSARRGHRAWYDPSRDRMIVYGGYGGVYLDDVWALSLSGTPAWTQLTTSGTTPNGRSGSAVTYDPVRDRMLVFGGYNDGGYNNELWQLSLTGTPTWSLLAPSGTTPTVRTTVGIYDPVRDRMVIWGGRTSYPQLEVGDIRSLNLPANAWTQLSPTGSVNYGSAEQTLIYDRTHDRAVDLAGGSCIECNPTGFFQAAAFLDWGSPPAGADIDVVPMKLDFGGVFVGTTASRNVVITNFGSSSLNVANITSANAAVTASPASFTLAPYASQNVTVQWAPLAAGSLSTTVTVSSNDPDQPSQVINVAGSSSPAPVVALSPASVHVTLERNQTTQSTLRIDNNGGSNLTWSAQTIPYGPNPVPSQTATAARSHGAVVARAETGGGRLGTLQSGGPDGFGYRYKDSDEPGGPAFDWIDVRSIGTQLPATADNENVGPYPIGFSFPFYGNSFTTFRMCTNGWISFTSSGISPTNTTLPFSFGIPENLVACFWDDLNFAGTPHAWYHSDGYRLVIQYQDVARIDQPGVPNTFEIVLYPDGTIVDQYLDMTADLTSCTVGIQNAARNQGLLVDFNAPYVHNALAVRITRPIPSLSPSSGTIPPGGHADVTLTFDSSGLLNGDYPATVRVTSNDPFTPVSDASSVLTVATPTGVPGPVVVDRFGLRLAGSNPAPGRAQLELALPRRGEVSVRVYDVRGALVREVERREFAAGIHPIIWDGRDEAGKTAGSGIYFVRATGPDGRLDLRVALIR